MNSAAVGGVLAAEAALTNRARPMGITRTGDIRRDTYLNDGYTGINQGYNVDTSASIIMGSALLFYSIGVWAERISGRLKPWHVAFFVLGLICDSWGTGMMFEMVGGMSFDIHGITGVIAIVLMIIHAVWALVVLIRKNEEAIAKFHRFSVAVWIIWLIPYLSPMVFNLAV